MKSSIFFLLMLVFGSTNGLVGQENSGTLETKANRVARAEKAIQDIKDGMLIIRLTSNSKKIEELNKMANSPDISASKRKRLLKMVEDTEHETKRLNRFIVEEFSTHYDFSNLLFMYDTAVHHLKNGVQKGIFVDKTLKLDPNASTDGKPFCIVYYGREPNNLAGSNVEGLLTLDSNFELLPNPFPFFVSQIKYIFIVLKRPEEGYFRLLSIRYNSALHRFYNR